MATKLNFRSIHAPLRLQVFCRMLSRSVQMRNDEVLLEVRNNTGLITLNRTKALNALNLPMIRTIHPVIKEWENDENISLIVMKGAGEKAFCAGGDVKTIAERRNTGSDLSKVFFKEEYKLNLDIGQLKTPFVAMINGITMGGGVGLSVHGKYRVATEKTLFAMPETAIGLFPDVGGGYFLSRLKGKLGLFLALTGHRLKSRDVFFSGVATHFVSSKEMPYLEDEMLNLISPSKEDIDKLIDSYHQKCDDGSATFTLGNYIDSIDRIFSGDTLEEIFSNLEKDNSEWAMQQLETLKRMSPVSMKVTVRQLQEGGQMSLAEDLKMEYRISQQCMANDDFYEGIRSVLVDRDHNPKWQHNSIEDVTDECVDSYFQRLPEDRELEFD